MVLSTSAAGGHNPLYGLAVARAAQARGWYVDLATPASELAHPTGRELERVVQSTGGRVVDIPHRKPKGHGALGFLESQLRVWGWIREAGKRPGRHQQYDIAYINDGDGWYLPCSILGMPFKKIRSVTVMLRIRHHHNLLGFNAAYPVRMGIIQRIAFASFLRCRSLAGVFVLDKPLVDYCLSHPNECRSKVHYVPDLGQTVGLVDRKKARESLGIGEQQRAILCIGELSHRKGITELVAGLAHSSCPGFVTAILIGPIDAHLSAWLRSELPTSLIASGRLLLRGGVYDNDVLAKALSAADGVWLGYQNHFGSSSVLWEAVHARLPVLGRDSGLIAWEIRSNGIGTTVNINDPAAVASALSELLSDETARTQWRRNALSVGPSHTAEAFGETIINTFSETIGDSGIRVAHYDTECL